jgi:predicted ATPase
VITEIEIEGFKSLEKVRLKLGKLNLFVGANASGKSNFFDALRVLQGIGYGFTISEVFNGKSKSSVNEIWAGVRGKSSRAAFVPRGGIQDSWMKFRVALQQKTSPPLDYEFEISPELSKARLEILREGSEEIFRHEGLTDILLASSSIERIPDNLKHQFTLDRRLLHASLSRALGNMQRLDLSVSLLRSYSQFRTIRRMGESGENFAALVQAILADESLRSAYLSWLRQLTPIEFDEVVILEGAREDFLFGVKEEGHVFEADVLSDGTLRFAALAASFFQSDMPDVITIEEIENGIHPSRLRLLVELLKSQSGGDGPQVFATTHSPVVLAWLDESDYETTFFCKRDETGASIIRPLSEIPRLVELVKKYPLGDLFTEGWMETSTRRLCSEPAISISIVT